MNTFFQIQTAGELSRVRAIADDVWPKTFREILSPEQIVYMMKMMYSPEVMEKELASGYTFELLVIDGKDAGYMVYAPYEEPGTMKLHKLYLLEEYQGKGYGDFKAAVAEAVVEEIRPMEIKNPSGLLCLKVLLAQFRRGVNFAALITDAVQQEYEENDFDTLFKQAG